MKEFEKWLNNKYPDVEDYCPQCPEIAKDSYIAGMERALQLYCEDVDVTDFHENILQELKELDN